MKSTRIPLDRLTWARWRRAVSDITRFEVGGRVKLLFAALFAVLLAINGLSDSPMGPLGGRPTPIHKFTGIDLRAWESTT